MARTNLFSRELEQNANGTRNRSGRRFFLSIDLCWGKERIWRCYLKIESKRQDNFHQKFRKENASHEAMDLTKLGTAATGGMPSCRS